MKDVYIAPKSLTAAPVKVAGHVCEVPVRGLADGCVGIMLVFDDAEKAANWAKCSQEELIEAGQGTSV